MSVILHAHPVRGASNIQRNASGEVATPPFCHWQQSGNEGSVA